MRKRAPSRIPSGSLIIFKKFATPTFALVKQRRKRRLVTVKKRIVKGKETDFGNKTQNTSYIERFNLTLRQKISYLQRKTLGYCKNQKNFQSVLWINLFDYNYRHDSRVPKGLSP